MIFSKGLGIVDHLIDSYSPGDTPEEAERTMEDVRASITDLLEATTHKRAMVGKYKGNDALLLPMCRKYMLVRSRFFGIHSRIVETPEEAMVHGTFKALEWAE